MTKTVYRTFFMGVDEQGDDSALNQFLCSHQATVLDRQFVATPVPGWAFCVSYVSGSATETIASPTQKPRIDYREVLSEAHFALFDSLRQLRTSIAEREAKQVYSVFTNAQLAAMVQGDMTTLAQLRSIKDVGESRCNNYGELFLQRLQQARSEQA